MKKSIVLGILGLAAGMASSYGQGFVALDNYGDAQSTVIVYGPTGGGALNQPIAGAEWKVGLYFAAGTVAENGNPNGTADPSVLNPLFALGTGAGSVTTLVSPGTFAEIVSFQATAATPPPAGTPTSFMIVAYNGVDYLSSLIRGHSAAFTIGALPGTAFPPPLGEGMGTFQVNLVPEPSTLALAGLGLASLLFARRRK